MDTTELTMNGQRVVEAEFKLPKLSKVELRKVDWAPVRKVAADVLLTGLGLGVLVVQGAVAAAKAAHTAGASEADKPGTVVNTLVRKVRGDEQALEATGAGIKLQVPVLPIADYDALSDHDVLTRLETLTAEQLAVLRNYETAHAGRATVLQAIQARLA